MNKLRQLQNAAAAAQADADEAQRRENDAIHAAWLAALRARQEPGDELAARRANIARRKADEAAAEWAEWAELAWEAQNAVNLLLELQEEEEWYSKWEQG